MNKLVSPPKVCVRTAGGKVECGTRVRGFDGTKSQFRVGDHVRMWHTSKRGVVVALFRRPKKKEPILVVDLDDGETVVVTQWEVVASQE